MKFPVFHLVLFVLVGWVFSPPIQASHPSDSLFFSEEPPRPAVGKSLADLDVGPPLTVRLFYLLPNDRPYRPEIVQKIKDDILHVQTFFKEQIRSHGFGDMTFRIETDEEGEPLVHRVDGQYSDKHYRGNELVLMGEVRQVFDLSKTIAVFIIDNQDQSIETTKRGTANWYSKQGGFLFLPENYQWQTLAHELGHTFGIGHDFRNDDFIMSYGFRRNSLSSCSAGLMAVHPYFNPGIGVEWTEAPTIELLSETTYPEGSQSVPIRLKLGDPDGLHMVRLNVRTRDTHRASYRVGGSELKLCRHLAGETEAEIEIEYDGIIPSGSAWDFSDLSDPKVHPINIIAVDTDGNREGFSIQVWEIPRQHRDTIQLTGQVNSLAFAPDGARLASGSEEGVRVWNLETGSPARLSEAFTEAVALSPDGRILAFGSDGQVRLLDTDTGQTVGNLSGLADPIGSIAFSPDGALLASGDRSAVRIWDLETHSLITTFPVEVAAVSFSPDGTRVVSASVYDKVQLWDLDTQTEVAMFPHASALSASFSPDGTMIVSGGEDATVKLWEVATGNISSVLKGEEHKFVHSVVFSPDGSLIASGADITVHVWDSATKALLGVLRGEGREMNTLAFSADGTRLAAGTYDGTIELWDVSEWQQPRPRSLETVSGNDQEARPGSVLANPFVVEVKDQYGNPLSGIEVVFSVTEGQGALDGRFTLEKVTTGTDGRARSLLTLGSAGLHIVEALVADLDKPVMFRAQSVGTTVSTLPQGDLHTWNLPEGALARIGKGRLGYGDRVVDFSPDGQLFAVGTGLGIWIYEVSTSRELALFRTGNITAIAFSPDGSLLASGGPQSNPAITIWDIATGEIVKTLGGEEGTVALAFSPDGTLLASGSNYGIDFWEWETETQTASLSWDERAWGLSSIAFSPDGTILAGGGWTHFSVEFWDVATATHIASLEGHTDEVESIAFSPDGTTLVSASSDHDVRLWDVAARAPIALLEGHEEWVFSVDFAPDGNTVVSGGAQGTVRLWDVPTGTPIAVLEDNESRWIRSVAFSPSGKFIATGAMEGLITMWDTATENAYVFTRGHRRISKSAFSPDAETLAYAAGSTIGFWDLETGADNIFFETDQYIVMHDLEYSSDGSLLALAEKNIRVFDVATGALVAMLDGEGPSGWAKRVIFSPDGSLIATGFARGTAKLWDFKSGTATALSHGKEDVFALAFSLDGTVLATGDGPRPLESGASSEPVVKLWDVATGTLMETYDLPTNEMIAVWFTPDGNSIGCGRVGNWPDEEMVEIWDLSENVRLATLTFAEFAVYSMRRLAGVDVSQVDWDELSLVASRTPFTKLENLAFSRDGRTFAARYGDGTILIWDMELFTPRPQTLTKLSGDEQEVSAGDSLAEPLVVTVLDQHGDPFVGATVTFAVTSGAGVLSARTDTTDENGNASSRLTLGRLPGRNTVTATVATLESVVFGATGQAIPLAGR